jgi:hypothetical protein
MKTEGRLLYNAWWLDDRYRYNMIPFQPRNMSPDELARLCLGARRRFYSWFSIALRAMAPVNRRTLYLLRNHLIINAMHHWDVEGRSGLPLGDESWTGKLIPAHQRQ